MLMSRLQASRTGSRITHSSVRTDACTELSDHSHGADTIQFFQLRRSKGGCEKFHGAVIAHVGTNDTRVFKETAQLGRELESFGTRTLGTRNKSDVGIIFDWDNYWALEYTSGPTQDLNMLTRFTTIMSIFTTKISQSI